MAGKADPRSGVLVSVADLAAALEAGKHVVLLDVSDDLTTAPLERPVIPGAFAVSLASDISGPPTKEGGRRPLPDIAVLQETVRGWGVHAESLVVVYDNAGGAQAGRAWWTFRWAGHENVRLLDGGLKAWQAAGKPVADQPQHIAGGGTVTLSAGHLPAMDADGAQRLSRRGILLDARGKAAYEGEAGKPKTGHIPGAVCAPSAQTLDANGCFKSSEELKAHFAALGADGSVAAGVYCGSGNAASHLLAAMHVAGLEAPLYVGSWSAWSEDPARPVAQGPEPG
ncbi:MAG: sulfurtransferase [Beijerinckiaceae bacterium]